MDDLISRQALLGNRLRAGEIKNPYLMVVPEFVVRNTPAIEAEPVVRCKDCKHYCKLTLWCNMNSRDRDTHYNWYEDDFCSHGERRAEHATD